jgi:CheY-like chemotaxis protein
MKGKILIVDDEFGLADVLSEILSDRGYEVFVAINGRLGLAYLEKHRPDVVLLDIMMPVLDGLGMLRAMRAHPDFRSIPVIMMTAVPEALPKEKPALFQGALAKPFTPKTLFSAIDQVLAPA